MSLKNIFKDKFILSNRERLNNILRFANDLSSHYNYVCDGPYAIFYLIKLYTDKINNHNSIECIEQEFFEGLKDKAHLIFPTERLDKSYIESSFKIHLGKDPVITKLRDKDRLCRALNEIGTSKNPWKQRKINHFYKLYLPMGVTLVYNGNHSVASGIIKSTGSLEYIKGENLNVFDVSSLYELYEFDGTYYRCKKTGKAIFKPLFEFGAIFEIGRIIKDKGISFVEYKANQERIE